MFRQHLRSSMATLLTAVLLVPILAACGGAQQPAAQPTAAPAPTAASAEQPTTAPEATVAPAPTEAAAPTEAPAEPVAGGPQGNTLRIAAATFPDTLDPQKSSFVNEIEILALNYEGLTRLDKDLKTIPAAAESWEYNSDATAITFKLREGLKYSDGSPLTANDFVLAIQRTLSPIAPGDYQTIIDMIKGADAIINTEIPTDEAKLPELNAALGVKAVDDLTLTVEFVRPTPFFHTLASLWVTFPAKDELVKQGGETWWEDPTLQIGNGPFQLDSIDRGANLITLKANPNYWQGAPKLDGIELRYIDDLSVAFQAYKAGEVDIMTPDPNDVPTIQADPVLGPEYKEYAGSCTLVASFNLTKAPFDNQKVREAFAYGFDREGYVRDALKGTEIPTLSWIPPGYPGYDASETRFGYDPEKAKAALAEAGYPNGEGLPEIKLSYNSNNPANQPRAEYMVQMYQNSLGISLVPDPVEGTTLVNLRKSVETYPQMLQAGGWCADYPDPQNWLSVYWHSRTNFAANTGYKNEQVDTLLDQADIEIDPAKRAALYAEAQKLIIGDAAEVMRSNTKNTFLIKPYVKGLVFTPQDSGAYPSQVDMLNVTLEP